MSIADLRDVEVSLLRPLSEQEQKYGPRLLDRAERLLTQRVTGLIKKAEQDERYKAVVADVEAEMVARVFRAGGTIYTRESEGDYSYSLNLKVASGLLDVLDEELVKLGTGGSWGTILPETDGYIRGGRGRYHHYNHIWKEGWYPCDW